MLTAQSGIEVVDHDRDAEIVGRQRNDVDPFLIVLVADCLVDDQVVLRRILLFDAGLEQHVDKRLGAAVGDGGLDVVELDGEVIDLEPDDRGKYVLRGVDPGIADAQRGPARNIDHVVDVRRDLRLAAKVDALKAEAIVLGRRAEGHRGRHAGVEAHPRHADRPFDGVLLNQHRLVSRCS